MPKYMTRQRKVLLDYLCKHADEVFSANQICDSLEDKCISQSAIYRNLAAMEREGKLKRATKAGSQEVYFRYADAEECRGHLHLSCVRCGKTRHMARVEEDRLTESLAKSEGFILNRGDTVLYGICSECQT